MQHEKPAENKQSSRGRRWLKRLLAVATLLLFLFFLTPYLLSSNMLRDRLLASAVPDSSLSISSRSASLGWFSPVTIEELRIESRDQMKIDIAQVTADRTWWELWWNPNRLGHFVISDPHIDCNLDWQNFEGSSAGNLPELSASVQRGSLLITLQREEDPVVDIGDLNVNLRIEADEQGHFLVIDDTTAIDNRHLTPEMCSELLQLMDPMLGDVVQVEGQFSLVLDKLRLPLNVSPQQQREQVTLAGRLQLNDVSTSAQTPLIKGVVRVASDMYGKTATEVVRVVNHATVDLEIKGGRLYHSGLKFGLPDIAPDLIVTSAGSVGLDESLDVHLSIPKLFLAEGEPDQATASEVARLHVTGTLEEPEFIRLDQAKENNTNELSQTPSPVPATVAQPASYPTADGVAD